MNGNQMAFVGLPSRGHLGCRVEKGGFLLVGDTPTKGPLTGKTSRLVFNDVGVASHLEDFCFEPFVYGNFVAYQRCPDVSPKLLQYGVIHIYRWSMSF
jgi:hypothetical protein